MRSFLADWVPDHGLQFFGGHFSGIAQVDLMVQPCIRDVKNVALVFHVFMHCGDGPRFIVIRADMHALDAQAFVVCQE